MIMAYVFLNPSLGMPPIATTSVETDVSGRNIPWKLGDIQRAYDPDYGVGEFIYLKGVASTAVGSVVVYNADDFSSALAAANAIGPDRKSVV